MPGVIELTNPELVMGVSVSYRPKGFNLIADKLLPPVPVRKKTFKYRTFTKADRLTPSVDGGQMALKNGHAQELDYGGSLTENTVKPFGFSKFISDQDVKEFAKDNTLFDIQRADAEFLIDQHLMAREKRVNTLVTTAGNYAASGAAANGSWDYTANATGDPIQDVIVASNSCYFPPNFVAMNLKAARYLRVHPVMQELIKYTQFGVADDAALLAKAFGVQNVYISDFKPNSGVPGAAVSYDYDFGAFCVVGYVDPSLVPDPERVKPSFGYTFTHEDVGGSQGYLLRYYRDETRDKGGTVQEVNCDVLEKITANDMAYLITGIY